MTIDIIFEGPPGPEGGRFVEVERLPDHRSIKAGDWIKRDDGYWALRLTIGNDDTPQQQLADEIGRLHQRIGRLETAIRLGLSVMNTETSAEHWEAARPKVEAALQAALKE